MFTAVGVFAGLFLAVAIVIIRDMLDTRVRNGGEAEQIVNVPVVGHFPAINA
jgi:capsular polysaccharide biosynthesis protein